MTTKTAKRTTKRRKSTTAKKSAKPLKTNSDIKPWSVKGVSHPTRNEVRNAARKSGMTIGAWVDRALLEAARNQGKSTELTIQETKLESAVNELKAEVRQIREDAAKPKGIIDRLFDIYMRRRN